MNILAAMQNDRIRYHRYLEREKDKITPTTLLSPSFLPTPNHQSSSTSCPVHFLPKILALSLSARPMGDEDLTVLVPNSFPAPPRPVWCSVPSERLASSGIKSASFRSVVAVVPTSPMLPAPVQTGNCQSTNFCQDVKVPPSS